MNDITTCRFFELLRTNDENLSCEEIRNSYFEFRDLLVAISDSPIGYVPIFRIFSDLHARLQFIRIKKKWAFKFLP